MEDMEAAERDCVTNPMSRQLMSWPSWDPNLPLQSQGLCCCALIARSHIAECSMTQILKSAFLQTLASSLLPTLPDFGNVTLNFHLLFYKREIVSPTSQSCQQDSGRQKCWHNLTPCKREMNDGLKKKTTQHPMVHGRAGAHPGAAPNP